MRSFLLTTIVLLGLSGCPRPAEPAPTEIPKAEQAPAPAAPEVSREPSLRVVITPTLEPAPRVRVAIEVTGPAEPDESLRAWSLPGPVAAAIAVTALDANGALDATTAPDGEGVRVTLDRAPSLPLTLEYELEPVPAAAGRVARLDLDEVHFFATGEALLLLPNAALDRRQTLAIEIAPDALAPTDPEAATGLPPLRAASSFAAEPTTELEGWPFELRRATFVAGLVEWARFDSMSGDDRWFGVGPTRFDQRWSAAELAGVRSMIDGTIGLPTIDPLVTILLGASRAESEPAFRAELRGRGLLIIADQNAYWDASARMTSTQALAARWLGGRIRLVDGQEREHAIERTLWFDAGVTRYVARETLYALGLLADEEYSAELDMIELELASSPLRERTLPELAAIIAADTGDPAARAAAADALSLLVARGAMYMAWLDHELRNSGNHWSTDGVIEVLRVFVARAIAAQRREFAVDELIHVAATKYSITQPPEAAFAAAFESVVVRGERPTLASDSFGPCFRPRTRKLRRFELGFVDTSEGETPSFTALDPEGPAAKAGLRADDSLLSLDYVFGDPAHPVTIQVARGDSTLELEYQPAGPARRLPQWERVADVPPEACVR